MEIYKLLNGLDFLVMGIYLVVIVTMGMVISWRQNAPKTSFWLNIRYDGPALV